MKTAKRVFTKSVRRIPVVAASRERLAPFGVFIGTEIEHPGLQIPFYKETVVEGHTLPFVCHGPPVVRAAQIHRPVGEVTWLERHVLMTQLFVGLGAEPFVMVLGEPTHERGLAVPDLDRVAAFEIPPGHGVMIHQGTWHDFPMASKGPVTVLTVSSAEVVETLGSARSAAELDTGDVLKIEVAQRLGTRLIAEIP